MPKHCKRYHPKVLAGSDDAPCPDGNLPATITAALGGPRCGHLGLFLMPDLMPDAVLPIFGNGGT
jgi:hypothetical protein